MPDLTFTVADAEVLPFAAAPTMLFKVAIANAAEGEQVSSIMLRTQIRLETTRRHYDSDTEARLLELFGRPQQWGDTLRSLLWTHATAIVPRFEGDTVAELPVACTYDFEVAAAKYFHALRDGEVPLLFLFSGTVFYSRDGGPLQIAQIPWELEAPFRLPAALWHDMMDRYFPNSAWLRVRRDLFDRLHAYRSRRALATWDDTLDELLREREAQLER